MSKHWKFAGKCAIFVGMLSISVHDKRMNE